MKKIVLISDTHGFVDDKMLAYIKNADEVWHAGDWGDIRVHDKIKKHCQIIRGVYGNIDDTTVRQLYLKDCVFTIEGLKVFITHIGGYPDKYAQGVRTKIATHMPDLFISGHSHILKVMRDTSFNNMLHMNPGAAGIHGFHKLRTWLIFDIENGKITNLNVVECPKELNDEKIA